MRVIMLLATQTVGAIETLVVQPVDQVEVLRQILARQETREVSYDEAREIGSALLDFYTLLADKGCDEPAD